AGQPYHIVARSDSSTGWQNSFVWVYRQGADSYPRGAREALFAGRWHATPANGRAFRVYVEAAGSTAGQTANPSSASNGKIYFASNRDVPTASQIYVMNADGSDQHALTTGPLYSLYPDVSPDGTRIAYTVSKVDDKGNTLWADLFVMRSDGSNALQLTSGHHVHWPKWSPDGATIAFADDPSGAGSTQNIYLIPSTGGPIRQLTNTPGFNGFPAWAPDGRIVFTSERDGKDHGQLYLMNADGSGQRRLLSAPGQYWEPSVSPDGRRIAFASDSNGFWSIYTMATNGTDVRQLTTGRGADYYPTWSPDGEWIAFHSNRSGNWDIYRVPSSGGASAQLTTSPAEDDEPAWHK
ncbi:MAG: hypothetical protein ACREOS_08280, partial [Candidatus Dormibacteraceae bacterium]